MAIIHTQHSFCSRVKREAVSIGSELSDAALVQPVKSMAEYMLAHLLITQLWILCSCVFTTNSQPSMQLQNKYFAIGIFLLDLGDYGGERNVVEDPARTAEYTTESTVVSIPSIRALNETCLECQCSPLHS